MGDTTILSSTEQYKIETLTKVSNKEIKSGHAAKLLGISVRQVQRLKKALKMEGSLAVVHGLRGKQSNHHIDPVIKEQALAAIKETYADFKPTFATEKLAQKHAIHISSETTRRWMMQEDLWNRSRKK